MPGINKIIPIGGEHRSAPSLLAEIMNDPNLRSVVVVSFLDDGTTAFSHFNVSRHRLRQPVRKFLGDRRAREYVG